MQNYFILNFKPDFRFLSLSDGSLHTINSDTFKGLEYLTSLFIDNSQVEFNFPKKYKFLFFHPWHDFTQVYF